MTLHGEHIFWTLSEASFILGIFENKHASWELKYSSGYTDERVYRMLQKFLELSKNYLRIFERAKRIIPESELNNNYTKSNKKDTTNESLAPKLG